MNDNIWDSWERFLKPENLKSNMIDLSLFVTSYYHVACSDGYCTWR